MKKIYKFFKPDCYPCKTVSAILKSRVTIPENIEIVDIDLSLIENRHYIDEFELFQVPTLLYKEGNLRLVGKKPEEIVQNYLNQVSEA